MLGTRIWGMGSSRALAALVAAGFLWFGTPEPLASDQPDLLLAAARDQEKKEEKREQRRAVRQQITAPAFGRVRTPDTPRPSAPHEPTPEPEPTAQMETETVQEEPLEAVEGPGDAVAVVPPPQPRGALNGQTAPNVPAPTGPEAGPAPADSVVRIGGEQGSAIDQPAPELPVNKDRPKVGEIPPGWIVMDYENRDLSEVIKGLAPQLGKVFQIDPTAGAQKVTIISHGGIPPEMAYDLLEAILATYQLRMVSTLDDRLIKIRPIGEDQESSKLYVGEEKAPEGFDTLAFHVVPLKHAPVTEISTLLANFASKNGKMTAYERTNTLVLFDTATAIRNMLKVIEDVDVPGYDEIVEFFTLEFARAAVIAEQIQQVLMGGQEAGGAGPAQAVQAQVRGPAPIPRPTRPGGPTQATQQIVSAEPLTLRVVADERLNSLMVVASQPLMERVRDLIDKLDTPTPPESNTMHVRELLHADAEKVEEALTSLLGGTSPRQTGARPAAAGSGAPGGGAGGGGGGTGEVQPFEKNVQITRYDQTNSLLIIASPQDYRVLDELIQQIDVPSRQVHVEAIIMEVAINDRFRLSVESAGLTANDYFALNNVINLANVLAEGPLAATGTEDILTAGLIDGTTTLTFPDGAGGTITQEVPNVPLLLTALESLTALDVLSRPSLITVDNEEASIVDGQDVPIVTGTQRPFAGTGDPTGGFGSVFTQTERREIGVNLRVTPQISEGDYVFLDLEIEVSRPIQSTVGIDPNTSGITLSLSKVTNKVVVRDGMTGVLGGLISESTDRGRRQTPILGDIPGLGWLFGRRESTRIKRNLVVLITPHIVKEGIDYERLSQAQMAKATKANADVFFERGIIKKVSKKAYLRSRYRPTEAAIEEVTGGAGLERGDVEK